MEFQTCTIEESNVGGVHFEQYSLKQDTVGSVRSLKIVYFNSLIFTDQLVCVGHFLGKHYQRLD